MSEQLDELRARFREWPRTNLPLASPFALPQNALTVTSDEQLGWLRDWQACLYDAGFVGAEWPTPYGGRGLPRGSQRAINERNKKIHNICILISMLIFSLFGTMQSAHAACSGTVYVNAASGSGSPNGCSWGTAFPKLQDALAIADSGDQIWVTAGTYYPDEGTGQTNNARSSTFALKSGVAIYGGFAGTETLLSQRNANPATNNTVLSGDIDGTPGDNSANAYHVVTASNLTASAILDGFSVSGGNTPIPRGSASTVFPP